LVLIFKPSNTNETSTKSTQTIKSKPLNITIFLDLSDRIMRTGGPGDNIQQVEKDSTIIMSIQQKFYDRQYKNGKLHFTKDKIRVICYPAPQLSTVDKTIRDLEVDLNSKGQNAIKDIKGKLNTMQSNWSKSVSSIYRQTLRTQQWVGSDIWKFFNGPANVQCVDNNYRNILIILTDGYIYHKNSWQMTQQNEYTGIAPKTVNTQKAITPVNKKYTNLEVMFLEINTFTGKPTEFNKIEQLINDWCDGMGIKNIEVVETDLPNQTQKYIDKFIGW